MKFLKPKIRRLCSILLFLTVIGGIFWLHQTLFIIKNTSCSFGRENPCPDKVREILQQQEHRSIFLLNQNQLKKNILATGWGDAPQISFHIPGQLRLVLEPLHSSFPVLGYWQNELPNLSFFSATNSAELIVPSLELEQFLATNSGQPFLLLESGLMIEGKDNSQIYLIDQSLPDRDYLPHVFSWIKAILYREIKYQALFFVDKLLFVKQNQLPDLVFSVASDPQVQITALQEIIKATTIKDTKVIDFTYNHPILR